VLWLKINIFCLNFLVKIQMGSVCDDEKCLNLSWES